MKKITKDKLTEMYNTMTNRELCEKLNMTNPTLIKLLKGANIPLKGKDRKVSSNNIIIVD